jgi:PAS domain S-box-containing protein
MAKRSTRRSAEKSRADPEGLLRSGLDVLSFGFAVFDRDLKLITCNQAFGELRGYPAALCRTGTEIDQLYRFNAERGDYGPGDIEAHVKSRLNRARKFRPHELEYELPTGRTLNIRYHPIAGDGLLLSFADVTEMRRAETALRKSEARYALVEQAATEGIYEWLINEGELHTSPRMEEIFGFEADEVGPRNWDWNNRIHPDDFERYKDALVDLFKGRSDHHECEYRVRDKAGRFRWILDRGVCVRNEQARAVRLVGAISDISARKELETALRESEQRYALALEAVNEGVYEWNIETGEVYYSPRVRIGLGLSPDHLKTAEDWMARIRPEDRRIWKDAAIAHFKGETERFECEVRYRGKEGDWRWARQHGIAVRNEKGRACRMIGSTGDITEQKKLAGALERAQAQLKAAIESISEGFSLYDSDDRLVLCNDRYGQIRDPDTGDRISLGTPFEEVIRRSVERGLIFDAEGRQEAWVQERLAQHRAPKGPIIQRRNNGRWLRISERKLADGSTVAIYTDITELKEREDELDRKSAILERTLENMDQGISMVDGQLRVITFNQKFLELLQFPPERFKLGYHMEEAFRYNAERGEYGPGDVEQQVQERLELSRRFEPHHFERVRPDGTVIEIHGTPLPNKGGFVTTYTDITARKHAQEELRRQNDRLREEIEAHRRSKATIEYLVDEIKSGHNFEEIVGESEPLKGVLDQLQRVAATDSTVLIQGETGTGKELFVRAIHNLSMRKNQPLVKVNCAALPRELIESELFGHERGAFTGATQQRKGRFELADKGTIFLDEVGELSLEAQAKLLRVLQEQEFERVGGTQTMRADIRMIAATNRDLATEVDGGGFRSDLFYRLSVFPLTVPPLRERRSDIPLLARYFLERYSRRLGKRLDGLAPEFLEELVSYSWPGNVRELENVIERAAILSPGTLVKPAGSLHGAVVERPAQIQEPVSGFGTLEDMERAHISGVLASTGWTIEGSHGAARILGLNPSTLRGRMRKLGIKKPV